MFGGKHYFIINLVSRDVKGVQGVTILDSVQCSVAYQSYNIGTASCPAFKILQMKDKTTKTLLANTDLASLPHGKYPIF